jgi:hypothetical protein
MGHDAITVVADIYYCTPGSSTISDHIGGRVILKIREIVSQDEILESVLGQIDRIRIPSIYQIIITSEQAEDPRARPVVGAYRFVMVENDPSPQSVYICLRTLVRVLCRP